MHVQVAERIVLAQSAYMLFYIRKSPPAASPSSPAASSSPTIQTTSQRNNTDGTAHAVPHSNGQHTAAAAGVSHPAPNSAAGMTHHAKANGVAENASPQTSDSSLRKRRAMNGLAGRAGYMYRCQLPEAVKSLEPTGWNTHSTIKQLHLVEQAPTAFHAWSMDGTPLSCAISHAAI